MMKNKKVIWLIVILLVLLVVFWPIPKFINHPMPNLSVSIDAFEDVGCVPKADGVYNCTNDSPLLALGCNQIEAPSNLLGGLDPSYPLAICYGIEPEADPLARPETRLLRGGGFSMGYYLRYVILLNGEAQILQSEEGFLSVYAPIESPEEALSYVLAVKELDAYYGLQYNLDNRYEVDTIEDTHVTYDESDGYQVHLYYYEFFDCGPHWTYEVVVSVTINGFIQELSRTPVFRDPTEDGTCID
jgi:hypothetical protein